MATIPESIDYGARPSVRSNRLDMPGSADTAIADAIVTAASQFERVVAERKQKQDALNYATAKSELLTEDIRLRRELAENPGDYENYEEKYNVGMAAARDRITPTINNAHDQAIFDADANLTVARGVSSVAEIARTKRIDVENAVLDEQLFKLRDAILDAEPMTRNDMLMTAGDLIGASIAKGNTDPDVGGEKRRQFVKDVAVAELYDMDAADAVEALKDSIAGNPSQEDIEAGRGTGSLADFLHNDEKTKLLEVFSNKDEAETTLGTAFAASNAAWELYPDYRKSGERKAYLRDKLADDPKALKEALAQERQRTADNVDIEGERLRTIYEGQRKTLIDAAADGRPVGYNMLDQGALAELDPQTQASLRAEADNFIYRDGWNDSVVWEAGEAWRKLTGEEKVAINLKEDLMPKEQADDPFISWRSQITGEQALVWQREQQMIAASASGASEPVTDRGLTPSQLLAENLIQTRYFDHEPTKADNRADKARWARLETAWSSVVAQASEEKGGKLTGSQLESLMARFMEQEIFIRTVGFDDPRLAVGLTADERLKAYIPLTDERASVMIRPVGQIEVETPTGRTLTIDLPPGGSVPLNQWLSNMASTYGQGIKVSNKDLEEAIYYYHFAGPEAAVSRILGNPTL